MVTHTRYFETDSGTPFNIETKTVRRIDAETGDILAPMLRVVMRSNDDVVMKAFLQKEEVHALALTLIRSYKRDI